MRYHQEHPQRLLLSHALPLQVRNLLFRYIGLVISSVICIFPILTLNTNILVSGSPMQTATGTVLASVTQLDKDQRPWVAAQKAAGGVINSGRMSFNCNNGKIFKYYIEYEHFCSLIGNHLTSNSKSTSQFLQI